MTKESGDALKMQLKHNRLYRYVEQEYKADWYAYCGSNEGWRRQVVRERKKIFFKELENYRIRSKND